MSKKYKNSPLTEVVAQFNFIPSSGWNATIPGLLYENIKKDFPEIKQRPGMIGMMLVPDIKEPNRQKFEPVELVQFWGKTNNLLVQTGKDILSINALKPYPTWEKFYPHIIKTLDAYCKIANPKGLTRASLRYINSIEVNSKNFSLEENFEFELPKAKNLNKEITHFSAHMEYDINKRDVFAKILQSVIPNRPNTKNISFQLEVIMNKLNGLLIKNVPSWLNESHEIIIETFEASLNERLKKTYE